MDSLFSKIDGIHNLKEEAREAFSSRCKRRELKKGELLQREGETCKNLYFLEQGAIRGFYHLDDKEITHWFAFENDFVTSFHSFITVQPSVENLDAIEDCVLWSMSKQAINELFDEFPSIERLMRKAYEKYYIRLEERYVNSQFKTATRRYQDLLETNSHILQRVPLGYIASYLGISQETLSRIRAKVV